MRTRLLALAVTIVIAGVPGATAAFAQTAAPPTRRPDVIFVPTPEAVVEAMLQVANVTKNDVVYDLGCGDGRIPVTAARKYGARGVCFDIDPERIKEANENVARNNVGSAAAWVERVGGQGRRPSQGRRRGHRVSTDRLRRRPACAAHEAERGGRRRPHHRHYRRRLVPRL